jgi:hydrogenase/urease accessory protein HupE
MIPAWLRRTGTFGASAASRTTAAATLTAAFVLFPPCLLDAHDPGLSALEVRFDVETITATVSLAANDARIAGADLDALRRFAAEAIELRLEGRALTGIVQKATLDENSGASILLTFPRGDGTRLRIHSRIATRLALGHRELVSVRNRLGNVIAERMLDPRENVIDVDIQTDAKGPAAAPDFVALGVRHILGGYDHLLFLAALLLGVRRLRHVVQTITAFTVAHSLTLALAVLGFVDVSSAVVEPAIAASIVFVGLENLYRRQIDARWKITFAFGLVHGLGFAGALQDLGIGGRGIEIIQTLASFNVGVEVGQIGVALLLWPLAQRLYSGQAMGLRLAPACSVAVVVAGAYWLVERMM